MKFQAQAYICPRCFDDHYPERSACSPVERHAPPFDEAEPEPDPCEVLIHGRAAAIERARMHAQARGQFEAMVEAAPDPRPSPPEGAPFAGVCPECGSELREWKPGTYRCAGRGGVLGSHESVGCGFEVNS